MTRAVPVTPAVSAGIDVSAATLDVHLHPLAKAMRFANDEAGINDLCRHLKDHKAEACVFEVTGHYSRALHKGLHAAGLPAIPVNPRQASFFIKSHSPSHKTDRTDAAALAAMALALPLRVVPPPTPVQQELHELVSTRTQLIRDRVAVSLRHEVMTAPVVRASLEALLATLEEQIRVIDRAIGGLVEADPDLSAKAELIESIPGIGRQCARAIMAYMP